MTRYYTNKLLEMIDQGMLDTDVVVAACVQYMSEDDVRDMMETNMFLEFEDVEEDLASVYTANRY
jgi:hypothetical protein